MPNNVITNFIPNNSGRIFAIKRESSNRFTSSLHPTIYIHLANQRPSDTEIQHTAKVSQTLIYMLRESPELYSTFIVVCHILVAPKSCFPFLEVIYILVFKCNPYRSQSQKEFDYSTADIYVYPVNNVTSMHCSAHILNILQTTTEFSATIARIPQPCDTSSRSVYAPELYQHNFHPGADDYVVVFGRFNLFSSTVYKLYALPVLLSQQRCSFLIPAR